MYDSFGVWRPVKTHSVYCEVRHYFAALPLLLTHTSASVASATAVPTTKLVA